MEYEHLATPTESCREYARNAGSEQPWREYIVTPFDTLERNPYYVGPPGPHPDDYEAQGRYSSWEASVSLPNAPYYEAYAEEAL